MEEHVRERRAAIFGPSEPVGLFPLITPDLELAADGMPWVEGTDEDPAWYLTD